MNTCFLCNIIYLEVTCPKEDPKLKPNHGRPNCIETSDSTMCYTECSQNGFVPESYAFTVCNANGQWSAKLPDCKGKTVINISFWFLQKKKDCMLLETSNAKKWDYWHSLIIFTDTLFYFIFCIIHWKFWPRKC